MTFGGGLVKIGWGKQEPVDDSGKAFMEVLIGEAEGAPHFYMRRFVLEPGARMAAHRHPDIEHEQYVLQGRLVLGLDEREIVVGPDSIVFIPAGTVHWYENREKEPAVFLCLVPKTAEYRTEWV